MLSQTSTVATGAQYRGPHIGIVASVYVLLKVVSVFPVSGFGYPFGVRPLYFPALNAPIEDITAFFNTHTRQVFYEAFMQFGTVIPLAIFTAAVATKLRIVTNGAAAVFLALVGGLLAASDEAMSGAVTWILSLPAVAHDTALLQAFHHLAVMFGGPGFTMPQGILLAAICVPAAFTKMLPKWMIVFGFALALIGELSWLSMLFPQANFLIPLCRWPGFIWLIIAGFKMMKTKVPI